MFGALELKAVNRFAAQHPEWRPIHTAVIGCLLAHRHPHSKQCTPSRRLVAESCGTSERTVDRAIAQLKSWGAIKTSQLKLFGNSWGPAQYTFLFELPPTATAMANADRHSRSPKSAFPSDTVMANKASNTSLKSRSQKAPKKNWGFGT